MVNREIQNFWQKWTHLHQAFTHRNGKFLKKQWFSDIFMTFIAIPVIIVVIWRLSLNTNLTVASFWCHSVQQGIFLAEDDLEFWIWPQITCYSIENVQISPRNCTVIFPDYQTLSEAGSEKSGVSLKSYTEVLRKSPEFFNESIRGDWPKQKVKNDSDRSNRWSLKKKEINIRTDPKVSR